MESFYRRKKMAAISELIRVEENNRISFGDYTLNAKAKLNNFEHDGGSYKVKTFKEITLKIFGILKPFL